MTISPVRTETGDIYAAARAMQRAEAMRSSEGSAKNEVYATMEFAALLGIDPATMSPPRQSSAAAAGASQDQFLSPRPAIAQAPGPATPQVIGRTAMDVSGPVLAAGTVVDGMVSAGPSSTGLASMTGGDTTPRGSHFLPIASDAAHFGYDPIALIRNRLAKMGVSDDGIVFERWTDEIRGVGGNRTSHYVRGVLPNGMTENFAVERVLQNPDITAIEIRSLLAQQT